MPAHGACCTDDYYFHDAKLNPDMGTVIGQTYSCIGLILTLRGMIPGNSLYAF